MESNTGNERPEDIQEENEYLCLYGEKAEKIQLPGDLVPKVEGFKYLGSMLTKAGTWDREVRRGVESRWRNWKKMTGVLCDRKVTIRVKGKIYSTVVRPAMLYAMEVVPYQ